MKLLVPTVLIACILFTIAFSTAGYAGDKSGLQWVAFTKGVADAKKSNKKILVDVYTDWCGWCKRMDAETYSDKSVAQYLKAHYVLIKLNAESDATLSYMGKSYTERQLAQAFGVDGYPSTLFLKSSGEPITRYPGYADAAKFIKILSFIGEDHYLTEKYGDYVQSH